MISWVTRSLAVRGMLAAVAIGGLAALGHAQESASAEGGDGFVELSNKSGQIVEARILSVSTDGKKMNVELRDGRKAEMVINVLTLDHQQLVKEWIATVGKAAPSGTTEDFSITVSMEKKENTVVRDRGEYYRFSGKEVTYEVSVWNRSRQPLTDVNVEYAIVMKNSVDIYKDVNDPDDDYDYRRTYTTGRTTVRGEQAVTEPLAYNDTLRFTTKPVRVDEVLGDGNYSYGKDELFGILVRITDPLGREIGVYHSAGRVIEAMKWSDLNAASGSETSSTPSGVASVTSVEIPGLTVRELDAWPQAFVKGDAIEGDNVKSMSDGPLNLSASIDIDESSPDGIIVVHGGNLKGYAFYIKDGELILRLRGWGGYTTPDPQVAVTTASLPRLGFNVRAEVTDSAMRIFVEGRKVAEAACPGFLSGDPKKGLSVGFETPTSALVGDPELPKAFAGSIDDLRIRYGKL